MRLAVSGGTFDPVHDGHIRPLVELADAMRWDQIWMVPAHVQPFKLDRQSASAFDRYAMLTLATMDNEAFLVSQVELRREGISYTIDTLHEIRRKLGSDVTIDWVVGDDNLERLEEWKDLDTIFKLANFVVLRRGGESSVPAQLESRLQAASERGTHGGIVLASNEIVDVSATEIRRRVREGHSITGLVPPAVEEYVRRYELYRD